MISIFMNRWLAQIYQIWYFQYGSLLGHHMNCFSLLYCLILNRFVSVFSEIAVLATGGTKKCITVSTLAEAEFFADKGFDDILYGSLFTQAKIPRSCIYQCRPILWLSFVSLEFSYFRLIYCRQITIPYIDSFSDEFPSSLSSKVKGGWQRALLLVQQFCTLFWLFECYKISSNLCLTKWGSTIFSPNCFLDKTV